MKLFLLSIILLFGNFKLLSQVKTANQANLIAIGFKELNSEQLLRVKQIISSDLSAKIILFCNNMNCFLIKIEDSNSFNEVELFDSIRKQTQLVPLKKELEFKSFVATCDDENKNNNPEIKKQL